MSNAADYRGIVNGASELARSFKAAGLDGPFVVAVTGDDARKVEDAIGHGSQAKTQVTQRDGYRACVIAGIELRWPAN